MKNNSMLESKEKIKKNDQSVSYEEITDLPDVSIELIDDDMISLEAQVRDHDGTEYESITDLPLTERVSVEIVDDVNNIGYSKNDDIHELDIESLSVEVDTIDEIKEKTSHSISSQSLRNEIDIEELSAEEFEAITNAESAADVYAEPVAEIENDEKSTVRSVEGEDKNDTLDEILDIIEDESALSGIGSEQTESADKTYREYKSKNVVIPDSESNGKNRINGIEEADDDILNDEFLILQSDLEEGEELILFDENEDAVSVAEPYSNIKNEIDTRVTEEPSDKEEKKQGKKINEIIIDISEDEKERFSKEFDIKSFKAFDLHEAEKIAREDIVFLSEDDLVEELQDIDLVPIDDGREEVDIRIVTDDDEFQHNIDDIINELGNGDLHEDVTTRTTVVDYESEDNGNDDGHEDPDRSSIASQQEAGDEVSIAAGDAPVDNEEVLIAGEHEVEGDAESNDIIETITVPDDIQEKNQEDLADVFDNAADADDQVFDGIVSEDTEVKDKDETVENEIIVEELDTRNEEVTLDELDDTTDGKIESSLMLETIPDEYSSFADDENVYIIDDENVETRERKSDHYIFEESELEKITADMVEVVEGDSRVLREANVEEDKDRVASIMSGSAPAFEDLLIDFSDEYSFFDEKTEFIDNTFISSEYREAEKTQKTAGPEDVVSHMTPHTVEILGLSNYEIGSIEDAVFLKDFENIDLSTLEYAAKPGYDAGIDDRTMLARYDYIATGAVTLNENEKISIEEDINGNSALIFEENIDDIENKLFALKDEHVQKTGETEECGEEPFDISDSVFILDNEEDVARFTDLFPEDKQQQIKILLKYLDGLFEKLPEDVIKKFAESEYFTLYSQVLNELDRQ